MATYLLGERCKKRIIDATVKARDAKQYDIARELTIALNEVDAVIKTARGNMRDNEVLNKALRIADNDYADSIGGCGDCVVKCDGKCTPWCYVKLVEYWKRKAMEHDK